MGPPPSTMSDSRLETLNELRSKELERSLGNRESALRSIYAARSPLRSSLALSPYAYRFGATGAPSIADDVRAEEAFLEHRRALYGDLRAAESSEVAAAETRLVDERCAEQCLVEEREQARRAATAEAIEARASEERRLREAEFNAAEERAAKARASEVEAATCKSSQARESESHLASARVNEDKAFADRRSVEEAAYSRSLAWHGSYHGYPYGAAPKF